MNLLNRKSNGKSNKTIQSNEWEPLSAQRGYTASFSFSNRAGTAYWIEKVLAGTKTIVVADYYAKVYGTSTQAAYEALKIAVDDMYYSEYVWQEIDDKGNINKYRSRFVSHIGYLGGQGAIEFVLTEKAREHILNLTKNFTLYEIKQLTYLGKYGIRLYELLAQWRSVGKVEFSLRKLERN